ncbi:type II secretion system protein N [Stutzerimonas azotifigens]|uniref:type II secretion system protein N n=1 Tax=Stutzerimonas azotifigens TaxID=291995 RepID=UPI000480FE3C|nr:type II secretion system protein N [Stutzerimonas azotifigens]
MPRTGNLQKLQQHAPLLAAAVLLCLFALYLARQVSDWLRLVDEPVAVDSATAQPPGAAPDLQRIAGLFGTPPNPEAPVGAAPETTYASDLGLTLHGSLVNRDPTRSSAIIQQQGMPPQLYMAGTELVPGVKLEAVYPDRIEVSRNGQVETLYFPTSASSSYVTPDLQNLPDPTTGLPPGSEPVPTESDAAMQQQMDALRQQMEEGANPSGNPPTDEQPMEDN